MPRVASAVAADTDYLGIRCRLQRKPSVARDFEPKQPWTLEVKKQKPPLKLMIVMIVSNKKEIAKRISCFEKQMDTHTMASV